MVRNHQDGYPYLNSHFFLEVSCQRFLDGEGRGIANDIKKKLFSLSNSTKKGNKSCDNLQSRDPSLHFKKETKIKKEKKVRKETKIKEIKNQEGDKNQDGDQNGE